MDRSCFTSVSSISALVCGLWCILNAVRVNGSTASGQSDTIDGQHIQSVTLDKYVHRMANTGVNHLFDGDYFHCGLIHVYCLAHVD